MTSWAASGVFCPLPVSAAPSAVYCIFLINTECPPLWVLRKRWFPKQWGSMPFLLLGERHPMVFHEATLLPCHLGQLHNPLHPCPYLCCYEPFITSSLKLRVYPHLYQHWIGFAVTCRRLQFVLELCTIQLNVPGSSFKSFLPPKHFFQTSWLWCFLMKASRILWATQSTLDYLTGDSEDTFIAHTPRVPGTLLRALHRCYRI